MQPLGLAQRIVVVVALAAVLVALGEFVQSSAAGGGAQFGWFGYAPLVPAQDLGEGLSNWEAFLLWLGLIALWTVASVFVLRRSDSENP
jgi:hypothetical protein